MTKTVMVIDDDQIQLNIVSQMLQKFGYKTLLFTHPYEATEYMMRASHNSDSEVTAVISDFNMPDLNGGELLGVFRSVPAFRSIPFFILTGYSPDQVMPHVLDLKLGGILKKPLLLKNFEKDFVSKLESVA